MVEKLKWCVWMCLLPVALQADVLPEGGFESMSVGRPDEAVPESSKLTAIADEGAVDRSFGDDDDEEAPEDSEAVDFCYPRFEDNDFEDTFGEDGDAGISLAQNDSLAPAPTRFRGIVAENTGRHKSRYPCRLMDVNNPSICIGLIDATRLPTEDSIKNMVGKEVSLEGEAMRHGDTGETLVLHAHLAQD